MVNGRSILYAQFIGVFMTFRLSHSENIRLALYVFEKLKELRSIVARLLHPANMLLTWFTICVTVPGKLSL
jgi:hypothetical protein